jgi:organic hydroperoxide reductase OsmC/OhrA
MSKEHHYRATIRWTGNKGSGTSGYRDYERSHTISIDHKATISASSDVAFRGDKTKHNPEDLLLASLSGCHMLWFLHLCADNGIVVTGYTDQAVGVMTETENGGGRFREVTLYPEVTITDSSNIGKLDEMHKKANERCFIANSVNFPVYHKGTVKVEENKISR